MLCLLLQFHNLKEHKMVDFSLLPFDATTLTVEVYFHEAHHNIECATIAQQKRIAHVSSFHSRLGRL